MSPAYELFSAQAPAGFSVVAVVAAVDAADGAAVPASRGSFCCLSSLTPYAK